MQLRTLRPRRAVLGRAILAAPLLLGACTGPPAQPGPAAPAGVAWAEARPVEVTLDEYAFRPERLALRVGEPVRLRLVNAGARAHDFTAPGFFASAATRPGDAAAAALRAAGGSLDVPAGTTREVTLLPLQPGTWPLDCDKPLHGMFGMTGEIVVTPPG